MKTLNAKRFIKVYFFFIALLAMSTFFLGDDATANHADESMLSTASQQIQHKLIADSEETLN